MALTRSAPLRRTPLRRASARKARERRQRFRQMADLATEGRVQCEIVPWIALAYHSWGAADRPALEEGLRNCRGWAEGIHERRKRSAGGSLENPQNLIPACNACNGWVERWPIQAHLIGLVVRAGDPEFEELRA